MDFRRIRKVVEDYRYLDVHPDKNGLNLKCKAEAVPKEVAEQILLLQEAMVLKCLN